MAPTTSVDQQLARLAGPALLAGGLVQFDEMVQAAMAGQIGGTASLGALGVCSSVFGLVLKTFNFLETATTPRVARCCDDADRVSRVTANALFTALAIGGAVGAGLQFGSPRLLAWLGTNPALLPACLPYMRARALGAPIELAAMAAQGALHGCRDTATPALASLLGLAASSAAGLVLMRHFGLGLLGLALGRLVAATVACAVLLHKLVAARRLQWRHVASLPPLAAYAGYARSAGPLFVRTSLMRFFFTCLSVEAAKLATASAAAHVVARQTAAFFSIILDSYATAVQSLIASHLGRDNAAARAAGLCAHRAAFGLALAMTLLLHVGAAPFGRLFTPDVEVHRALAELMPWFTGLQLLGPAAYVFDGIFLGAADFDYMAKATLVAVAAGFVALRARGTVLPRLGLGVGHEGPEADGERLRALWLAWGVHVSARSLCFARRFFSRAGPFADVSS